MRVYTSLYREAYCQSMVECAMFTPVGKLMLTYASLSHEQALLFWNASQQLKTGTVYVYTTTVAGIANSV